jgi:hypothetical protein
MKKLTCIDERILRALAKKRLAVHEIESAVKVAGTLPHLRGLSRWGLRARRGFAFSF